MKIFLWIIFIFLLSPIYPEPSGTQINYNGSFRVRGFMMGRDMLLERQTPTTPIGTKELEDTKKSQNLQTKIQNEVNAKLKGEPTTITKDKEKINYYDTWVLLNMDFIVSKYIDGLWGIRVGNIPFGGGPASRTQLNQPAVTGPSTGGEMGLGNTAGVNMQTNFLYINFKIPEYSFLVRTGIQLFSSVRGRVLYARGAGVLFNKDFNQYKFSANAGWIRARERAFVDRDANTYADKYYQSTNIYFLKFKWNYWSWMKNELYSYYYKDDDPLDADRETGNFFWHGLYNEFSYQKFNFIIHGIYNQAKSRNIKPIYDAKGNVIYNDSARHFTKGGLADIEISYAIKNNFSINLLALAVTGRPGYEKDGTASYLKGNGYRSLHPGFSISNIAVDWIAGYSLFLTGNLNSPISGLTEVGPYTDFLVFDKFQVTLGYFRLYATKSPIIENNREFNQENFRKTSNYLGQEVNANVRWNVMTNFQIIFRSGIFKPEDGIRALLDSKFGSYIKEAFVSAEMSF